MKGWQNPYLIIRADGVALLDPEDHLERIFKPGELTQALGNLPPSAWPYGRVVAVTENAFKSSADDEVQDSRQPRHRGRNLGEHARSHQLGSVGLRRAASHHESLPLPSTKCVPPAAQPGARARVSGWCPPWERFTKGHLSLVRAAKAQCDLVAASIFVNPLQFGPSEDLAKYPANFDRDRELFQQEGVDFIFAPSVEEMYPAGAVTYVTVEGLSDKLCGRSRPGHFRGVTTVVAKLFNIVEPDLAFFGQKDAAQSTIIRRMVRDLNIPVQIVVCPIVREPDGLAMSSRNAYLDPQQRESARVLYRSLMAVQERFDQGERKVRSAD